MSRGGAACLWNWSAASQVSRVHYCVMGRLIHTGLGSSSLITHVLHSPPPPREQVCNRSCSNKAHTLRRSVLTNPGVLSGTVCPPGSLLACTCAMGGGRVLGEGAGRRAGRRPRPGVCLGACAARGRAHFALAADGPELAPSCHIPPFANFAATKAHFSLRLRRWPCRPTARQPCLLRSPA